MTFEQNEADREPPESFGRLFSWVFGLGPSALGLGKDQRPKTKD
jgi:hypothetical protein